VACAPKNVRPQVDGLRAYRGAVWMPGRIRRKGFRADESVSRSFLRSQYIFPNGINIRHLWHTRLKWRETKREHWMKCPDHASRVTSAGRTSHTGLLTVSHGTQLRCWRRSRSPQRGRDAMRCRDKPVPRTARSIQIRFPVATRINGGRRLPFGQASAGPEGGLMKISIEAASVVRRKQRCAVPRPVSRSAC